MIDWRNALNSGMRGLVVEGSDDVTVLTAFLKAGENVHWENWTSRLVIQSGGGFHKQGFKDEIGDRADHFDVWGLLDREFRSEETMAALQKEFPKLLFLPRPMIENYFTDPDELYAMLPQVQRENMALQGNLTQRIEPSLDKWRAHGALVQTLKAHGAEEFCGRGIGYPSSLINPKGNPIIDEVVIEERLQQWHDQLDPDTMMPAYRQQLEIFATRPQTEQYRTCVHGKHFFERVVTPALNALLQHREASAWLEQIVAPNPYSVGCPADLVPILQRLLG